jgi:hypothetical protein
MAQMNARYPVPRAGRTLAIRTALGVFVAIIALLIMQTLVDTLAIDVGDSDAMSPFAAGPLIGTTIVAGVGAALVYAGLVRFTDRPVRNFVALAAAVFVFMLGPVAFVTPSIGVTPTGQAVLVLYHLLVAVPIVAFIIGVVEL